MKRIVVSKKVKLELVPKPKKTLQLIRKKNPKRTTGKYA